jgi:predicted transcriptional regulator
MTAIRERSGLASSAQVPTTPRLRYLRAVALLTQRELAERAGLRQATIARLETGNVDARPSTIRKLADALGVDPYRITGTDRPDPEDVGR